MLSESRNRVMTNAGLAEGTNANTFKTANTTIYSIKGVMYSKAATDNLTFTAGHADVEANQQCIFAVCLNAAGTVSTVQGPVKNVGDDQSVLGWPSVGSDVAMIGAIVVETGATTFSAGSTDLGAANVTDTYIDCDGSAPQSVTLY